MKKVYIVQFEGVQAFSSKKKALAVYHDIIGDDFDKGSEWIQKYKDNGEEYQREWFLNGMTVTLYTEEIQ